MRPRVLGNPLRSLGGITPKVPTIASKILTTQAANLIGYWKLDETSGTVANDVSSTNADGAYAGTVTLDQSGAGDGSRAALFAGGRVSLATPLTTFNGVFSGAEGTIFACAKLTNVGIWTDGLDHTLVSIGADASNRFYIGKQSVNNALSMLGSFGGVTAGVFPTGQSWTTFKSLAITWNKAANEFKAYINGVQTGATTAISGTYAGSLSASWTGICSLTSGSSTISWAGWASHIAVWKKALTPAEIAAMGVL